MQDIEHGQGPLLNSLFYLDELKVLTARLDLALEEFSPEAEWIGMPEYSQQEIKPFHTIKLHFPTEADMRAFSALIQQTVTQQTRYLYYPKQPKSERKFIQTS